MPTLPSYVHTVCNPVQLAVLSEDCLSGLQMQLVVMAVLVLGFSDHKWEASLQSFTALTSETCLTTTPTQPRGEEISRAALAGPPPLSYSAHQSYILARKGMRKMRWNTKPDMHATNAGPSKSKVCKCLCHYEAGQEQGVTWNLKFMQGLGRCLGLFHSSFLADTRVRTMMMGTRATKPMKAAHRGR